MLSGAPLPSPGFIFSKFCYFSSPLGVGIPVQATYRGGNPTALCKVLLSTEKLQTPHQFETRILIH
jgi:hypothetical protein